MYLPSSNCRMIKPILNLWIRTRASKPICNRNELLTSFLGFYPLLPSHISGWSYHQLDHSKTISVLQQLISQHLDPSNKKIETTKILWQLKRRSHYEVNSSQLVLFTKYYQPRTISRCHDNLSEEDRRYMLWN